MSLAEHREKLLVRPPYFRAHELRFNIPGEMFVRNDERVLALRLVLNRHLFGAAYQRLMPDAYRSMGDECGVLVRGVVPMQELVPSLKYPGDIDLLVIPYQGDELILSGTLAIEVKALRATFANPHKSPNQFGFSQAAALLNAGFPYVAVAHLIACDESPRSHWRPVLQTTILDADSGRCGDLHSVLRDMLPSELMDRSLGRLRANRGDTRIGLLASYVTDAETWFPEGLAALRNSGTSVEVLNGIFAYYKRKYRSFIDTPRFPPRALEGKPRSCE
jgi:hypothetical protein